jgi:hypothetical protein
VTQPSKAEQYAFFAVVLAALLAAAFYYHRPASVCEEAVARAGVAADLLEGRVEGRQALIGSLKWPPLPTMLAMPFAKTPVLGSTGLSLVIVNAVVAAFTLSLLNTWWATFGIPRLVRYPLLASYQASPAIIAAVLMGSSSTVMLLILTAGAYFLVRWLDTLDLRSLAYLGVLAGLSVITRYETIALVAVVTLVILLRVARSREKSFRPATLLVFLIPPIYTAGLWFLGNWLIMGDPVFFLRGLARGEIVRAEFTEFEWEWSLYLMPTLLLVTTWTLAAERARLAHLGRALSTIIAFATLVVGIAWPYADLWMAGPDQPYFGRRSVDVKRVEEIFLCLAQDHPDAKVFVSGYSGYPFVGRTGSAETFVHLMNLDLREIQRRTHGQPLLFLIPRPRGIHRWEDINLQAPWLFDDYTGPPLSDRGLRMSFILAKAWPDWRLLEVVRPDAPAKKP